MTTLCTFGGTRPSPPHVVASNACSAEARARIAAPGAALKHLSIEFHRPGA